VFSDITIIVGEIFEPVVTLRSNRRSLQDWRRGRTEADRKKSAEGAHRKAVAEAKQHGGAASRVKYNQQQKKAAGKTPTGGGGRGTGGGRGRGGGGGGRGATAKGKKKR
jgi:hypothetical protein